MKLYKILLISLYLFLAGCSQHLHIKYQEAQTEVRKNNNTQAISKLKDATRATTVGNNAMEYYLWNSCDYFYNIGKYEISYVFYDSRIHSWLWRKGGKGLALKAGGHKLAEALGSSLSIPNMLLKQNVQTFYRRNALSLEGLGHPDLAIGKLIEGNKLFPWSALNHQVLGDIFLRQKKYNDAIIEYDIASKLTPHSSSVYIDLAFAYGLKGDYETSENWFEYYQRNYDNNTSLKNFANNSLSILKTKNNINKMEFFDSILKDKSFLIIEYPFSGNVNVAAEKEKGKSALRSSFDAMKESGDIIYDTKINVNDETCSFENGEDFTHGNDGDNFLDIFKDTFLQDLMDYKDQLLSGDIEGGHLAGSNTANTLVTKLLVDKGVYNVQVNFNVRDDSRFGIYHDRLAFNIDNSPNPQLITYQNVELTKSHKYIFDFPAFPKVFPDPRYWVKGKGLWAELRPNPEQAEILGIKGKKKWYGTVYPDLFLKE